MAHSSGAVSGSQLFHHHGTEPLSSGRQTRCTARTVGGVGYSLETTAEPRRSGNLRRRGRVIGRFVNAFACSRLRQLQRPPLTEPAIRPVLTLLTSAVTESCKAESSNFDEERRDPG